jgi:enterochelin esterase-like enzyme
MEPLAGAWCTGSEIGFRLRDQDQRLSSVRVMSAALSPPPELAYSPATRTWEARVPCPPVQRLEYKLELGHAGGRTESVCDPDNPRRVPGGFGESSELWCAGYREPDWLHLPPAPGEWRDVYLPMHALRAELVARIWSPVTPTANVLVAHDGPDFHRYGELGRYLAAMIGANRIPPGHLVLLPPGERLEWYSASPAYARALATDVLPKIAAELGTDRPVVGIGASLGALAMLHAQRRHAARFAGLFLQSGSFFQPRFDRQESGFARWLRIVRFTGRVLRRADGPAIPAVLTCGTVEENLANNRDMYAALRRQGYPVTMIENADGHNWVGWRDCFDPHLTALLQRVWS